MSIPTEQDPRWQSVLKRDAGADGGFVYAVKTTGIYCRPSCPSRLARPAHVRFYTSPVEAEVAGYRACQRCRPDGPSLAQARAEMVAQACRLIEAAEEAPALDELAARLGVSPYHFHRCFKALTGLTPKAWGVAHRARKMRGELVAPGANVTRAIHGAGFGSGSRFYERANDVLGMPPTTYRNGGRGEVIHFALGACVLGAILVARTQKGICALTLGDDPELLLRDLQDRFPKAELVGGDAAFEAVVAQVVGFVEAPRLGLDLPLDIRGTAFQQRVWQALMQVPVGETVSYAEIAHRIGAPKAMRAVAQACGANAIAVAIPCHRVVRHDGALSGYRWGVERKRALLEREAEG